MPKKKFTMEFDMKRTPVSLLWDYISSAPGLAKWFADDVEVTGKHYAFFWNKQEQGAVVTAMRRESHIRLKWDDDDEPRSYFEMRILDSDFSDAVTLEVTDFADSDDEAGQRDLWRSQVETLRRSIGCK